MEQIKTKRLLLTEANPSDLPALEEIERECDAYFSFDPPCAAEHNRALQECLTMGDIIPGVSRQDYKRENYRLYCIWKDDALIGWLSLYLEYQEKDTAYLSVLYIKEACRSSGIGAEIIEAVTRRLASAHVQRIMAHCSLRNALALRFWVKHGFHQITEVTCDGNLYPSKFGGMGLMKVIAPDERHG